MQSAKHDASPEPASPTATSARTRRPFVNAAVVAITSIGFVALAGAGIAALKESAATSHSTPAPPPVRVETIRVHQQPAYETTVRYSGLIEATRQTQLAFEQGGLVTAVEVEEGAPVRKGDIIARLDTRTLEAERDQLLARRQELDAQLNLARLTRDRLDGLSQRGWTPEQRQDEANAGVTRLTAAVAGITAELKALDIRLTKSVLKAPFDGTVTTRAIDEGAVVAPGTTLVTLAETANLRARIGLPPAVAASLDPRQTYQLKSLGQVFPARLAVTRSDLDPTTRTVPILFDLTAPTTRAPIGAIAILPLKRRIEETGAWLPLSALKEGRRGLWTVLRVEPQSSGATVTDRAVEILHIADERAFVRGSLANGDAVVARATNRLVAGQRVALGRE